jgi:thiamine monophosphate synthase
MNEKILFEIKKIRICNRNRKFHHKFPVSIFFTDRKKISDFEETIKNLPQDSAIVVREYDLGKKDREIFAKKIIDLAHQKNLKILIGKDFLLAKKIKADGVHFSDFDKLPLQFFRKQSLPKRFIFSLACHSYKAFLKFKKLQPEMLFISPVFPTTSHVNSKAIGLKKLAQISFKNESSNYLPARIYALGGVNSKNIQAIRKLGLAGFGAIDFFKHNSFVK